jgi:uncharacterized protein (TIGR03083 family)
MNNDVWPMVHAEREALIDDLAHLDDERWGQPSLCEGWTVHDVAAHLVDTARTTRLGFVVGLVRERFDFDRQNARGVDRERGASPQETLQRLRQVASRRSTPPAPLDNRLVEELVHGEDIRRPLGLTRSYPPEAVSRVIVKSCGWWLGWCGRRPVSVPRLQEFLDPGNGVLGACVHVTGHAE